MKQKNVKLVNDLQKAHHEYVDLKHDNEARIRTCDVLIKKQRGKKPSLQSTIRSRGS